MKNRISAWGAAFVILVCSDATVTAQDMPLPSIQQASALLQKQDVAGAIAAFEQITEAEPNNG